MELDNRYSLSKITPSLLTLKEGSTALPKPLSPHGRGDVNCSSRRSFIKVGGASEPSLECLTAGALKPSPDFSLTQQSCGWLTDGASEGLSEPSSEWLMVRALEGLSGGSWCDK